MGISVLVDVREKQPFHFVSRSNANEGFDVSQMRDKFTSEIGAPLGFVRCQSPFDC